jgi:hypothetical protein
MRDCCPSSGVRGTPTIARMKRHIVISAILLLIAATGSAQMTHRPPSNGTPPNGGSNMGNAGEMGPMHLAVASDGTVVVIDRDVSGATITQTLVAYNASGAKAWTLALDGLAMNVAAAANQFYAIVVKPGSNDTPATRTLVAVSLSGVILWSQPLG